MSHVIRKRNFNTYKEFSIFKYHFKDAINIKLLIYFIDYFHAESLKMVFCLMIAQYSLHSWPYFKDKIVVLDF